MNILAIDGQYFFRRTQEQLGYKYNDYHERVELVNTLVQSFSDIFNNITNIDKVVFTKDTRSWRKYEDIQYTAHIKSLLEAKNEVGYKKNRTLDNDINWANAYLAFDEFIEIIEKIEGILVVGIEGAEGDDIFFVLSKLAVKYNDIMVLYTSDKDSELFVNENTILYKPQRKTYTVNYSIYDNILKFKSNKYNIFGNKNEYLNIIKNHDIVLSSNVSIISLERAVLGSNKENIYGCITWQSGTRKMRPNKKQIIDALQKCNYNENNFNISMLYNDEFIELYLKNLLNIVKSKTNMPLKEAINVFKSNVKLLLFTNKSIPLNLLQNIGERCVEYTNSDIKFINYNYITDYNNLLNINGKKEDYIIDSFIINSFKSLQ